MTDPMSQRYKLTDEELRRLTEPEASQARPQFEPLAKSDTLQADDMACFSELRAVLERHGKLERFGVVLLHHHFPLREGEILLESTDSSRRTMTLEPSIIDPGDMSAIDTQWYLGRSMPLSLVKCRTSLHT